MAFTCSKHMYCASGNYMLDILFYKKEIEKKKTLFRHFDPKQKCRVFIFVQYIFFDIPWIFLEQKKKNDTPRIFLEHECILCGETSRFMTQST